MCTQRYGMHRLFHHVLQIFLIILRLMMQYYYQDLLLDNLSKIFGTFTFFGHNMSILFNILF